MYRRCKHCLAYRHGDRPSIFNGTGLLSLPMCKTLVPGGPMGYHVETVFCATNYRPTLFARLFGRWL